MGDFISQGLVLIGEFGEVGDGKGKGEGAEGVEEDCGKFAA